MKCEAHSCYTTVVGGTELGPVYLVQVKQLKCNIDPKIMKMSGLWPMGAKMVFMRGDGIDKAKVGPPQTGKNLNPKMTY